MSSSPAYAHHRRWKRTIRQNLIGWAFIGPMVLLFALFRVWPAIDAVLLSFRHEVLGEPTAWVGLQNYRDLADDKLFLKAARNTMVFAAITVPISSLLSLAFALLVDRAIRGIGIYRAIYFLPYITSIVTVSVIWKWVYRGQGGLLNAILDGIGIAPVEWLTSPKIVLWSLAIMGSWQGVGFSMMILLAGLRAISTDVLDASRVDGASAWQTLRFVRLPLLMPVFFFVIVTSTIGALQAFDGMYVMTGGGPLRASYTVVFLLYDTSFKYQDFGYASTIGVALFLATGLILIVQKLVLSRES